MKKKSNIPLRKKLIKKRRREQARTSTHLQSKKEQNIRKPSLSIRTKGVKCESHHTTNPTPKTIPISYLEKNPPCKLLTIAPSSYILLSSNSKSTSHAHHVQLKKQFSYISFRENMP